MGKGQQNGRKVDGLGVLEEVNKLGKGPKGQDGVAMSGAWLEIGRIEGPGHVRNRGWLTN